MNEPLLQDFHLVGGTALALQIGHRKSIDLDLFGEPEFDPDSLFNAISHLGDTKLNFKANNTVGLFIDGIKVDIIRYVFPLIQPVLSQDGIRMLSIGDIAAMKLSAIAKRGSKKDFWDLYFILQQFTLPELFSFYETKFGKESLFFVTKSLSYFADADLEPDPVAIIPVDWNTVKSAIRAHIKEYL